MTDRFVELNKSIDTVASTLLARAKNGEPAAWKRLVDLHAPLVFWWCRNKGLQASDAEDVGQEVFIAVDRKLDDFRRDKDGQSFRGWLRAITKNKVLDFLRKKKEIGEGGSTAHEKLKQLEEPPSVQEAAEEVNILARRILEAIRANFSEKYYQVFIKNVIEGRNAVDVAERHDVKVSYVYTVKAKILSWLRDEFGDDLIAALTT